MSKETNIPWTDSSWNPWIGCTKIDDGCKFCYMFREQEAYGKDPSIVLRTKTWRQPYRWQAECEAKGEIKKVFTCSWSDWFHEAADAWREEAWSIVRDCPNLIFQILTKRADRIASHLPADWREGYPNVWLGVSISKEKGIWRADCLRDVPAAVRFISYEPALGPIAHCLRLPGIHWLIYGGESGPRYRQENKQWARDVLELCKVYGTAFFHKQSAALRPDSGIHLDGQLIREFPLIDEKLLGRKDLFS